MTTERVSALLTDLYQLNMVQAYLDHGETKTAVFEFFVRKLPARRGFLLAAGLEQALAFCAWSVPFLGSDYNNNTRSPFIYDDLAAAVWVAHCVTARQVWAPPKEGLARKPELGG